jgi:hypothetical protein
MMSRALILATLALVASCSSESSGDGANASFPDDPIATDTTPGGLHVVVRTAPSQPPPRGTCTVELTVTDASGAPKDGLTLDVVPWMPAHAHGASVRPTVVAKGGGNYLVTNVSLFMPGEWELRTTIAGPVSDHAAPKIVVP